MSKIWYLGELWELRFDVRNLFHLGVSIIKPSEGTWWFRIHLCWLRLELNRWSKARSAMMTDEEAGELLKGI